MEMHYGSREQQLCRRRDTQECGIAHVLTPGAARPLHWVVKRAHNTELSQGQLPPSCLPAAPVSLPQADRFTSCPQFRSLQSLAHRRAPGTGPEALCPQAVPDMSALPPFQNPGGGPSLNTTVWSWTPARSPAGRPWNSPPCQVSRGGSH